MLKTIFHIVLIFLLVEHPVYAQVDEGKEEKVGFEMLLGNWEDVEGVWRFQITPGFVRVDNQLWEILETKQEKEVPDLTITIRNRLGQKRFYTFSYFHPTRLKVLDAYLRKTYELRTKPYSSYFYTVDPGEIPSNFLGEWYSHAGPGEDAIISRKGIILNGNRWQYEEIIFYQDSYQFLLRRKGRYLLWVPKFLGNKRMTGIMDRNIHLRFKRSIVEEKVERYIEALDRDTLVAPRSEKHDTIVEQAFISPQTPKDSLPSYVPKIAPPSKDSLPGEMLGNWTSRSGDWVFDLHKTFMVMDDKVWFYDQVVRSGKHYQLSLLYQPLGTDMKLFKPLDLFIRSDHWMEVEEDGIRYDVLSMPFTSSFFIETPENLPDQITGDWYHTLGAKPLLLSIDAEGLTWKGLRMKYAQIIRKEDRYYMVCSRGENLSLFRLQEMEEGFLQSKTDTIIQLFQRKPIPISWVSFLPWILGVLVFMGGSVWGIMRWRNVRIQGKEMAKRREIELELKALRSQMNPHFMFNSLSSIQNLINKQEPGKANHYLSRFSSLMRKVLNHSDTSFISLEEEIAILDLYCELEALRFAFDYHIEVDEAIDIFTTEIPAMLIQPFVENAIRHGIGAAKDAGLLTIHFTLEKDLLCCVVDDNGIGIEASLATKKGAVGEEQGGYGMRLSQDRLQMIQQQLGQAVRIEVMDKKDLEPPLQGTRVHIYLPTNLA